MVAITSLTCSITCVARISSNELSRNGYGGRSKSHSTSAAVAELLSMPMAPGDLLRPQPMSRVTKPISPQSGEEHKGKVTVDVLSEPSAVADGSCPFGETDPPATAGG